jgi:hypothetical protein
LTGCRGQNYDCKEIYRIEKGKGYMARHGKIDEELGIENLVQITLTVSLKDIELWKAYSAQVGYATAATAREFFRTGLMAKIAESNKALVWAGLVEKQSTGDRTPGD